jgi:DNA-binding winged helix-turn-helix (wHTH) protein
MRVAFDRFVFDSEQHQLQRDGEPVHLVPKAFCLLEILIERRPRPIAKRELCERIWHDTVVDESNLAGLINELRTALGDRARKPRFIRTVHGFGYAFCGESGETAQSRAFVVYQAQQLPLREGLNVLGRDATADVQVDHVTVSRKHAAIEVRGDEATIQDLSSKNGTFVDGVRIEGASPLRGGQTVVLGDASLVFRTSTTPGSTISIGR